MHETTILLFNCRPLNARISKETCRAERTKGKRKLQFNNGLDYEGVPVSAGACQGCQGVKGGGEKVAITAAPPRPPRVAVMTIDGVYGYVG